MGVLIVKLKDHVNRYTHFFEVLSDFPSLRLESPKNQLLIILINKLMNNGANIES